MSDPATTPLRPGLFTAGLDAAGPCPYGECGGDGWVLDEASDTAVPCRCREQRVAARRTRGLGRTIPERFRHVSFESPEVQDLRARVPAVVRAVQRYCDRLDSELDAGRGLGFHGDVGTGKTTLAYLVTKAALRASRSVAVYSFPRLLVEIRDTYRDDSGAGHLGFLERLVAVDLLQLDDLGAEKPTDWVAEQLFLVIDGRYEARRSIVYTTNLAPGGDGASGRDTLADRIGARAASRLAEMSAAVPLYGSDHRTAQAPELP
ncbi:MAG: ATP-binding protein [Solirubrobacteraceae bacterium]